MSPLEGPYHPPFLPTIPPSPWPRITVDVDHAREVVRLFKQVGVGTDGVKFYESTPIPGDSTMARQVVEVEPGQEPPFWIKMEFLTWGALLRALRPQFDEPERADDPGLVEALAAMARVVDRLTS